MKNVDHSFYQLKQLFLSSRRIPWCLVASVTAEEIAGVVDFLNLSSLGEDDYDAMAPFVFKLDNTIDYNNFLSEIKCRRRLKRMFFKGDLITEGAIGVAL